MLVIIQVNKYKRIMQQTFCLDGLDHLSPILITVDVGFYLSFTSQVNSLPTNQNKKAMFDKQKF